MELRLLAVLALSVLLVSPVSAAIVSGSVTGGDAYPVGEFRLITLPFIDSAPDNTIGSNNLQELNLYGLNEAQNVTLTSDLTVDVLADGSGGGGGGGVISSGTVISSQYIFFDPFKTSSQQGTVSFDGIILGLITSNPNLGASDFLQADGITYLGSSLRGLEGGDSVTITGLQSIDVDWTASSPGDYIRVITAVPVPPAVWLFGTGLLALLGASRFRKSSNSGDSIPISSTASLC